MCRKPLATVLAVVTCLMWGSAGAGVEPLALVAQTLKIGNESLEVRVADGYRLERVAGQLERPRMITLTPAGELLIGSRAGKLYRLRPPYDDVELFATPGGYPHSAAVRGDRLFVARTDGLYGAPYVSGQQGVLDEDDFELIVRLPSGAGHSSRTVGVGPDGRVYVSLGLSGNCSDEYLDDSFPFAIRRGGVFVLEETRRRPEFAPFASGLRNPVGFAWRPGSGDLYASNNGPDHLGYDRPPEHFSHLEEGSFHGMPWYVFDGESVKRDPCIRSDPPRPLDDVVEPRATFPPRSAPLGVAFVPSGSGDTRLAGDAVVALHGSWATRPHGAYRGDPASRRPPKLVAVRFDGDRPVRVDDLVTGFQAADGSRWARPAGVAVIADGSIFFTSDAENEGLFRLRPVAGDRR